MQWKYFKFLKYPPPHPLRCSSSSTSCIQVQILIHFNYILNAFWGNISQLVFRALPFIIIKLNGPQGKGLLGERSDKGMREVSEIFLLATTPKPTVASCRRRRRSRRWRWRSRWRQWSLRCCNTCTVNAKGLGCARGVVMGEWGMGGWQGNLGLHIVLGLVPC